MRFFTGLIGHFRAEDAPYPPDGDGDPRYSFRSFLLLLLCWLMLWTILPSAYIGNVPIDVAENIAWGQNFQLGYDKNPYFGAWLTYAVFRLCPHDWVFYLLSQIAVFLGVSAAYKLTREVTRSDFAAFVAGVSTLLIPFFSHSANEFNDDVMSIALWGLTALYFYRAVRKDTVWEWLAAGAFAGLAFMTKYLAGALLFPLGMLLLATPEGRKCWKKPGIYLGAAVFLLLVVPNVVWLFKHDFIAIRYAFGRAALDESIAWSDHLVHPAELLRDFFSRLILPAAAILLFRKSRRRADDAFGRAFMYCAGGGPLVLSFLFALVTGGDVLTSWLTPYYVFAAPLMVTEYRPLPGKRQLKCFAGLFILTAALTVVAFTYEYPYRRPYLKRGVSYNVYPGRQVAAELTRRWHDRFRRPAPYVIGNRTVCCYMNYYSCDRPRTFFDHDIALSPSIDPADVEKRGAVVIWRDKRPEYLERYSERLTEEVTLTCERAVPRWIRAVVGAPGTVTIHAVFIAPRGEGK